VRPDDEPLDEPLELLLLEPLLLDDPALPPPLPELLLRGT
jgi:hypothetical protein